MRKLKFRAWDKYNDKMVELGDLETIFITDKDLDFANYEVMQFTGLLDKNGAEIYEGDVVYNDFTGTEREVVRCDEGWFFAEGVRSKIRKPIGNDKVEVLGNIYENEDLISKGK